VTPKDTTSADGALPFGAISDGAEEPRKKKVARKKKVSRKAASAEDGGDGGDAGAPARKKRASRKAAARPEEAPEAEAARSSGDPGDSSEAPSVDGEGRKRRTRRGRRRRGDDDGEPGPGSDDRGAGDSGEGDGGERAPRAEAREGDDRGEGQDERPGRRRRRRRRGKKNTDGEGEGRPREGGEANDPAPSADGEEGGGRSRRRRRNRNKNKGRQRDGEGDGGGRSEGDSDGGTTPTTGSGMFILDKGNVSVLRQKETGYLSSKKDIYVSKKLVQKHKLRDGMMITGPVRRGYKHKLELDSVEEVDGHPPKHWDKKPTFQNLTSVDPDFHYAVGDVTDNVSMRVVDLISPIGRGQRGLLVAPPRTGKTTIMREFAAGIEKGYPDVHLMVLLIDERPEEATEWRRSVEHGEVFVSTADETSKHHIQVAEVVWKRAMRMVEMGEDVILLLDSITRLARAYNNNAGPGKTMSGGLDSRAMERPRKIFGSARNTVEAGSLTILGTTLVETGSRLDQLVFEEFKGTGNMELVLNRKLSDRRIFPAIDIEKSGTRKEEKLVGMKRLKQIHILRRVLARMHFAEAAELLISRLMDVEKTMDFLDRFSVDPED